MEKPAKRMTMYVHTYEANIKAGIENAKLRAENAALKALLAEVGEPEDDYGCCYCRGWGNPHKSDCLTVRIKTALAEGGE